jgi:hypothetical protein
VQAQLASRQTVQVARTPSIAELPRLQRNLRAALQPLDDVELARFAEHASYESGSNAPALASVDWPRVLGELRALAGERKLPEKTLAYLDLQHAYYVGLVRLDPAGALQILDAALAHYGNRVEYLTKLALLAENIARDDERWNDARAYLARAEESLAAGPATSDDVAHFHGASADLWLDLGLPERARPHVEFELERARATNDQATRVRACADELTLFAVEENYTAVVARYAELRDEPWFACAPAAEQGWCLLHVAAGLLAAEHDEVLPRGQAAALLDELLEPGRIDPVMRKWALRHRAVCAANDGDWNLARRLCESLRCEINAVGLPDDAIPRGRVGEALVGLEARIELARDHDAPDRERRLRSNLDRVRRAWTEFLSHWSGAPARGGGLGYLHIAERHQLLQELIELELAVGGEAIGASQALQHVLDAEQQSTLSRRMRIKPTDVEELRRELTDSRAGLLVYLPSRDRSFVFALDTRGVRLFHLDAEFRARGPCHALAAAAQSAVRAARGIEEPELVAAAADCARVMLPAALEEHIAAWRDVLVVGIDDFGYVPIELLPARGGGTQGTRRAISYCATGAMALTLQRAPTPGTGHARLLLAPDVEGSELPLSDSEMHDLVSAVSRDSEILAGADAVASRLSLAADEKVTLLYVFAHGTHDATSERPGVLLMSPSSSSTGNVRAEDVEAMNEPPMVLITACQVGRAPMRRGDGGRSDLAAAFIHAGAQVVVLPTCDLEAAATVRAVPRILRSLTSGMQSAEALRSVRAELIAEHDPGAALQAHLLHVVGRGRLSLPPQEASDDAAVDSRARWMLLSACGFVLALWLLRASTRSASRAATPHGSRTS